MKKFYGQKSCYSCKDSGKGLKVFRLSCAVTIVKCGWRDFLSEAQSFTQDFKAKRRRRRVNTLRKNTFGKEVRNSEEKIVS